MTSSAIPALLPALTYTAAVIVTLVGWWRPAMGRVLTAVTLALVTTLASWGLWRAVDDGPLVHAVGGWAAPLGIDYVLDTVSGFVAVLVGSVALLVVLYPTRLSFGVSARPRFPVHGLLLLLVGGLLGVTLAGDLFNLFVALEIYSLASYALVALGGPAAAVASFRYLLVGTVGSSFYLLGVGFLYFRTGTLSMAEMTARLDEIGATPAVAAGVAMIVIGLGIKMAVFPLHVWLPDAHSHAPPGVAALLAAVQVKVAAYAIFRILFLVLPAGLLDDLPILTILTWASAAGVLVGSWMAVRQDDFKRMLAHSTVAQIGYIGLGIGLGTPLALVGALLHMVNHAAMKACLFFVAGNVREQAGAKKISDFAGLGPRMPWTAAGLTVAALSMVGIPPLAGFFSKWYLVAGAAETGAWAVALVIVLSSLFTLFYMLRILETIWFRPASSQDSQVREADRSALLPVVVLAAATIVLGLVNLVIVENVLEPVVARSGR
jgi:multicomponent Na+:H+ antiporter subunit D